MDLQLHLQQAITYKKGIPSRSTFKRWVECALQLPSSKKNPKTNTVEMTIRIVDDKESEDLNVTYRHKPGPTNILSFPYEPVLKIENFYLGDLAICAPLVAREASAQSKLLIHHWAHLTVHGVLHLLGYDHEREEDAEVMEAFEVHVLDQLGYKNPYS